MRICVYGLGALGSNLLVQLAKQYPETEFVGVDFDKVEERNIRTQAYFLEHVRMHKADAIRIVLSRHLRKLKYISSKLKIEKPKQVIIDADLSIDCFDNSVSRKVLWEAKDSMILNGELLHIGFSPFKTAEIIWNDSYDVPGDVDPTRADICQMDDAVGFINFVVSLSVMTIHEFITKKEELNLLIKGSRITYLK
jgi:molybdopterin/thiamine biosynthesis adenylyltransferase